jgi:hypothetical protein
VVELFAVAPDELVPARLKGRLERALARVERGAEEVRSDVDGLHARLGGHGSVEGCRVDRSGDVSGPILRRTARPVVSA